MHGDVAQETSIILSRMSHDESCGQYLEIVPKQTG